MLFSKRLLIVLAALLTVTLMLKLSLASSVLKPASDALLSSISNSLEGRGFVVAGTTSFAGRDALMAERDGCVFYFIPVSEHGWHQETVRTALIEDQELSFLYGGAMYHRSQPRWMPLLDFYAGIVLNYTGLTVGYNPVYAVVSPARCLEQRVVYPDDLRVPFRRLSLFAWQSDDY